MEETNDEENIDWKGKIVSTSVFLEKTAKKGAVKK